jgi:putative effector of murein hydrolase
VLELVAGLPVPGPVEIAETAGAFAGLGMGLNAVATSVLVPLLARVLIP